MCERGMCSNQRLLLFLLLNFRQPKTAAAAAVPVHDGVPDAVVGDTSAAAPPAALAPAAVALVAVSHL